MTGSRLPEGAAPDSLDLRRSLLGGKGQRTEMIVEGRAVRKGPWKYIWRGGNQPPELFDLRQDPGESTNLAARHPEVVKDLHQALLDAKRAPRTR